MKRHDWKYYVLLLIACLTILAGIGQAVMSSKALTTMGVSAPSETLKFFFILLSFLIMLFGGLLLHEVLSSSFGIPLLWTGLQKIVSVIFLIVGISNNLLTDFVWLIIIYDFICGLFLITVWILYRKNDVT